MKLDIEIKLDCLPSTLKVLDLCGVKVVAKNVNLHLKYLRLRGYPSNEVDRITHCLSYDYLIKD